VPEPWAGHIDQARLLFLSSNPSYNVNETYPTDAQSADPYVIEYFQNRFGSGPDQVHQGIYPPPHDPERARHGVRYWISVRSNARWLFGREVVPGVDYCLSEVVHCKSQREIGVRSALPTCTGKWLEPVLRASAADVVVAVGVLARQALSASLGTPLSQWQVVEGVLGGRSRLIVSVPHPNSRGPRRWSDHLIAERSRLTHALN
jgi:hypothetical protein